MLKIGCHVIFVDPVAKPHDALVTAIWGQPEGNPLVNVIFCSDDESRQDSYGRQFERSTSVCYRTATTVHGFYWMFPGETQNPIVQPTAR